MSRLPCFSVRLAIRIAFAFAFAAIGVALGQDTAARREADALLRDKGLVPRGSQWELKDEPLLRRRLDSLEQLQQEIAAARRQLSGIASDNRVRWSQIGRQFAALQKKLKSLPTDHKDRRKLEQQLSQLRRQAAPPDELAGAPHVTRLVKQLIDWELSASAKLLWSRPALEQIRQQHRSLSADVAVARGLQTLGAELGSLDRYRDAEDLLEQCDALVHRRVTPLYREGGQWRVGVLINRRRPATVSWLPESDLLLLPSSLADAIAARPDTDRSAQRVPAAKGRVVSAEPILIGRLRLGDVVMTDVKAWRLPPEAEDLGARVGQYSLSACRLELHPERLQAVIASVR